MTEQSSSPSSPLFLLTLSVGLLQGCNACRTETNIVAAEPHDEEEVYDHDWGRYLSLAAMPDGSPALSYYDGTKTGLGFALGTLDEEEDGTEVWKWSHEEVDGYADETGLDTGDRGLYTSMAIAADGTAWVGYQDVTNGSLRYASRASDGAWTTGIADVGGGTSPQSGAFASLALDASGSPVIAHYDQAEGELRVAHFMGSAFSGEVVDEGSDVQLGDDTGQDAEVVGADVGQFVSLTISGGVEYLAYYDAAAGALKLAFGSSGAYSIETIDDEGDVGAWPDIEVVNGTIHITYQDVENEDLLYVSGEPGAWTFEEIDTGPNRGADSEVFAYGSYIATIYQDGYTQDLLFAWRSASGWQLDTIEEAHSLGFHNEVLTTEDGTYVACYQHTDRMVWFDTLDATLD